MLLLKIKKVVQKNRKNKPIVFEKPKNRIIQFLNRPINTKRLEELEDEKSRIQFYYPQIK